MGAGIIYRDIKETPSMVNFRRGFGRIGWGLLALWIAFWLLLLWSVRAGSVCLNRAGQGLNGACGYCRSGRPTFA